jgi:hypothetical protein
MVSVPTASPTSDGEQPALCLNRSAHHGDERPPLNGAVDLAERVDPVEQGRLRSRQEVRRPLDAEPALGTTRSVVDDAA